MEARILQLIGALRASGVRISLAESADAFSAINLIGIEKKEIFRLSLRSTLIKEAKDLQLFDRLFPLFFSMGQPPGNLADLRDQLTPDELKKLTDALNQIAERLRQYLQDLIEGKKLSRDEMEQLAKMVGLNNVDELNYQAWMAMRMERAFALPALEQAIKQLMELLMEAGFNPDILGDLKNQLDFRLEDMKDQINQFTGERIAENLSRRPPHEVVDNLLNRPFRSLTEEEKKKLAAEVKKMAAVLRTKIALRQKRMKSGKLDAKATIRANLKHLMVPMEIRYHNRVKKPKLVVICDISTSMRFCSQLMLSFVYALQGQVKKTHAFAFIDHLEYITDDLSGTDGDSAVSSILRRMPSGSYNTDLGWSLSNFVENYYDTLNGRTTLIIVGDGRNNYNNPRMDLFKTMTARASRTLWLNPEPSVLWGTGDSDMQDYAIYCQSVFKVENLAELAAAIDQLMAA